MKNILLIGASGGLGNHFTKGLAESGYNLALHYNNNSATLNETIKEIGKTGVKISSYKADIADEQSVKEMVDKVKAEFGSIDILINNAGLSLNAMSWKLTAENWNKVIGVNMTGPFLCSKHVIPVMRENNWGRIIFMSSVVGQVGVPGTAAYAATKSALNGLCKTISKELVKTNITANIISLGYFDAGLLYQIPEDIREQIKETIPLKKFGDPSEILECILYICSDKSSYLTGQTINLNGGLI